MWLSPDYHTRSELPVFLSQCCRLLWILLNKVKHQVRFIKSIYFWELKGRWRKAAMTFSGLELNPDSIKVCCLLNDGCCCSEREMLDRFNYSRPRLSIYLEMESNSLFVAGCLRINHVTPWNRCPIGVTGGCDMFGLWCSMSMCSFRKRPQPISSPWRTHGSITDGRCWGGRTTKPLPLPHEVNFFQRLNTKPRNR